jgi:uncharacterized membrane protein
LLYSSYEVLVGGVAGPGTIPDGGAAGAEAEASGAVDSAEAVSVEAGAASAGAAPAEGGEEESMKVPRKLRHDVTEENLDAIAAAVDEVESRTSGEVMVHIVHNLLPLEKPRARALRAFFQLGVNQTRERNGVLLFVAMKKRLFEIVADEAIHGKVGERIWSEISAVVSEAIDHDGFEAGICLGVSLIGDVLAQHFPRKEDDVDELPDRPVVESE